MLREENFGATIKGVFLAVKLTEVMSAPFGELVQGLVFRYKLKSFLSDFRPADIRSASVKGIASTVNGIATNMASLQNIVKMQNKQYGVSTES